MGKSKDRSGCRSVEGMYGVKVGWVRFGLS